MFQKAYEIASNYTSPLLVGIRFFDKTFDCGLGSFVVVNDEGWLLTAAHNFGASFAFNSHQALIQEYKKKSDEIQANTKLKEYQKKAALKLLKPDSKWVTDFIILFFNGKKIEPLESYIYGELDLAVLRIDKKEIEHCKVFPHFIKPETLKPGTSLCKLGFPLYEVKMTLNEEKNMWEIPPGLFPIPRFPIEGIFTREMSQGKTLDGSMDKLFIETSSPGLKGQSGGPILDIKGNICGIQSQNMTLDLGFKGKVKVDKKEVEENQFINLGIGVHVKNILHVFDKHKIKHALSE